VFLRENETCENNIKKPIYKSSVALPLLKLASSQEKDKADIDRLKRRQSGKVKE